jgi:hypothetical protein
MACGHRLMLGSHITTSSTAAALVTRRVALPAASPRQVTNYGWRISPLLLSRDDATRDVVELFLYGHRLINPHIYVVKIENSGSVPIVPGDFDSPILIRLNQSIFLWIALSWNRPDILREEQHNVEMSPSSQELRVGPMLLNPGDALTLVALVELADDDLSVIGRLAGVEQIVQIPPADWASYMTFFRKDDVDSNEGGSSPKLLQKPDPVSSYKTLHCIAFQPPLLTNPNNQAGPLLEMIEVKVNGTVTTNPTMLIYGFFNSTGAKLSPSDFGGPITVLSHQSIFRHARAYRSYHLDNAQERTTLPIKISDHEVRIEPPGLNPDETLHLDIIVDGPGDDLEFSSPSVGMVGTSPMVPEHQSPLTVKLDHDRSMKSRLRHARGRLSRVALLRKLGLKPPVGIRGSTPPSVGSDLAVSRSVESAS